MKNRKNEKYWETEKGEVIFFGKKFMRYFENVGKLQFGYFVKSQNGEEKYFHQFTLDRDELTNSDEGLPYLQEVLDEWEEFKKND